MDGVDLLPCPFCGGDFVDKSYDRGTTFKCEPCGYDRHFPGLLQMKVSEVPIPYVDKEGKRVDPKDVKFQEYYHQFAKRDAIIEMNKRAK